MRWKKLEAGSSDEIPEIETSYPEVVKLYAEVREELEKLSEKQPTHSETDRVVSKLVELQRRLELCVEQVKPLKDATTEPYVKRSLENLETIKKVFHGVIDPSGGYKAGILASIDGGNIAVAHQALLQIRHRVYEVLGDCLLIKTLRMLPSQERAEARSRLMDLGIAEVVDLLDELDNLASTRRYKQAIRACQEVLSKSVELALKRIGGEPTDKLVLNVEKLFSAGAVPDAVRRSLVASNSYLSELQRSKKLSSLDVSFAVRETYLRINQLCSSVALYLKSAKPQAGKPPTPLPA